MNHDRVPRWRRSTVAVAAVAALTLAACGGDDDTTSNSPAPSDSTGSGSGETIGVVASFYPLQFVAGRVGGDLVDVTNLTPAGAEPHDLELTPRDTAALQDADLVVYLAGFTPAVDDAVASVGTSQAFDVAPAARLDLEGGEEEHEEGEDHADEDHADEEGEDHADEEHADEHDHGGVDPHFWLDPTRLADVADSFAVRLGELAPDHAADFTANAVALRGELEALDGEFETGLASCANTDIVTSHSAFGYLAQRYGLTQVGIAGLSPEEEPSPAKLGEVTEFVRDHDVSTIYYETLVDPAIAQTVADETGAATAVLDPIEGLADQSAGSDYFEVMRSNLESLRTGQDCT
ncbi:MAG TPA: zinc ABC transporter substrate-binding protein [Ilumatobacter sp.]|nr:zinc ABC transporter substrate-binding protein [Ilumatobacter sp.]